MKLRPSKGYTACKDGRVRQGHHFLRYWQTRSLDPRGMEGGDTHANISMT